MKGFTITMKTIFVIIIVFIFIFAFALPFVSSEVITRGQDFNVHKVSDGLFDIELEPLVNYYDGQWIPTNVTLTPLTSGEYFNRGYDYGVSNQNYQSYFKNNPTEGQTAIFVRNGTEITYQPHALKWTNDLSQIEQISMPVMSGIFSSGSKIQYLDAYGSGRTLQYDIRPSYMKEELVLLSPLPAPAQYIIDGGNPVVSLDFILSSNASHIVIDGLDWDLKTQRTTSNPVDIRDDTGHILYTLPSPKAYDASGNEILGLYQFKKSGGSLFISVMFPYAFLQNATYPVTLDPTTIIYINQSSFDVLFDTQVYPIDKITFFNATTGNVSVDTIVNSYAIDPTQADFDYAIVYVNNATGNELLKCTNYNFTYEFCGTCLDWDGEHCLESVNDTFEHLAELEVGGNYSFILTGTDPLFYEYVFDDTESTTNSLAWVTKLNETITIDTTKPHLVLATWGNTIGSTLDSVQSRFLIDGVQVNNYYTEAKDSNPAYEYLSVMSTDIQNLTAGNHTFTIQYRTNDAGVTAYIKQARITVVDLDDYEYYENNTPQTTIDTAWTTVGTLTFTPSASQDWMLLTSGLFTSRSAVRQELLRLVVDGSVVDARAEEMQDVTDNRSFGFHRIQTLSASSHTIQLQAREGAPIDGFVDDIKLIAIPMTSDWDLHYNESNALSTTTSTTPVLKNSLIFTPDETAEYMILSSAGLTSASTADGAVVNITLNGQSICHRAKEAKDLDDESIFNCHYVTNLTGGQEYNVSLLYRSKFANVVGVNNSHITAVRLTPTTQKLCEYTGSGDWNFFLDIYCYISVSTSDFWNNIIMRSSNTTVFANDITNFNNMSISNSSTMRISNSSTVRLST